MHLHYHYIIICKPWGCSSDLHARDQTGSQLRRSASNNFVFGAVFSSYETIYTPQTVCYYVVHAAGRHYGWMNKRFDTHIHLSYFHIRKSKFEHVCDRRRCCYCTLNFCAKSTYKQPKPIVAAGLVSSGGSSKLRFKANVVEWIMSD